MDIDKTIKHWGMSREEVREYAATALKMYRDKNRPNTSDRNQYDAWTSTMIAVITEPDKEVSNG